MTLEVMAGPINMTLDPEDSTLGGVAGFQSGQSCIWLDDMGWFGSHSFGNMTGCGNTGLITCNLDGVTRLRTYLPSAFTILTGIAQDALTDKVLVHYASGNPYLMNQHVGGLEPNVAINSMIDVNLRTKVGWYRMNGSNIQRADLDAADDTGFATEYTFTPSFTISTTRNVFSLGRDNLLYFYTGDATNPLILAYDYVLKTEVFPNPNGTGRWELDHQVDACYYSAKLGVFMTYEEDGITAGQGILYVYSTEMGPNALSNPVADPAVTAGAISNISTTLTDDQGVGIPGRLIDWSITVGNGDLLDDQTTTDDDGIATTQYRAEITGGVNPTIQASLTY